MGSSLLDFIKKTGVFLIGAESILHFMPGNSYQKYVRVLIGIMILAQFMIPVKAIFTGQEKEAIEQQITQFRDRLETQSQEMGEVDVQIFKNEAVIEEETKEVIWSRLDEIALHNGYIIEDILFGETIRIIVRKESEGTLDADQTGGSAIQTGPIDIPEIKLNPEEPDYRDIHQELLTLQDLFCAELGTGKAYLEVVEGD